MSSTRQPNLHARLAREVLRLDPVRAAAALEGVGVAEAASFLGGVDPAAAAEALAGMTPHAGAAVLERLAAPAAAALAERLERDVAARLLRRLGDPQREGILAHVPPRHAGQLATLLRFPENTAGALMDPGVLAIRADLTADEARRRVLEASEHARYNVYVVDHEQRLIGVVNLRELLLAPSGAKVADIMVRDPLRLDAHADRAAVVAHPGWKYVHSIPVVDAGGGYLGAVRYRTLRQLEDALLGAAETDADASQALGELFATGAAGLLDALGSATTRRRG